MSTLFVNNLKNAAGNDIPYTTGAVLQVKQSFIDTVITSGSTSFVTSGVAVVITPKSTSSKILLTSSIGGFYMAQNDDIYATIYRGSTNLGVGTANCFFFGSINHFL